MNQDLKNVLKEFLNMYYDEDTKASLKRREMFPQYDNCEIPFPKDYFVEAVISEFDDIINDFIEDHCDRLVNENEALAYGEENEY